MKSEKLLFIAFIIVCILDTLGIILPDYINREITTYFPIPIIVINYIFKHKEWNLIYLISTVFTFMGVALYNMHYIDDQNLGILCYGMGVIMYLILLVSEFKRATNKLFLIVSAPFLLLYIGIFLYYSRFMGSAFVYMTFYGIVVGLFTWSSLYVYTTQKNQANTWVLVAGLLFMSGTICTGYSAFLGSNTFTETYTVWSFIMMHYAMMKYVSLRKNPPKTVITI